MTQQAELVSQTRLKHQPRALVFETSSSCLPQQPARSRRPGSPSCHGLLRVTNWSLVFSTSSVAFLATDQLVPSFFSNIPLPSSVVQAALVDDPAHIHRCPHQLLCPSPTRSTQEASEDSQFSLLSIRYFQNAFTHCDPSTPTRE